jgi:hypothetical protein
MSTRFTSNLFQLDLALVFIAHIISVSVTGVCLWQPCLAVISTNDSACLWVCSTHRITGKLNSFKSTP